MSLYGLLGKEFGGPAMRLAAYPVLVLAISGSAASVQASSLKVYEAQRTSELQAVELGRVADASLALRAAGAALKPVPFGLAEALRTSLRNARAGLLNDPEGARLAAERSMENAAQALRAEESRVAEERAAAKLAEAARQAQPEIPVPAPAVTPAVTPAPRLAPKPTSVPRQAATPKPVPSSGTANSRFFVATVDTPDGQVSVRVMRFELGAGKVRVAVDSGDDADCARDCTTLPVKDFADRFGGFAAVNGTYFCPADYASCSEEKGNFFWKVLSPRTGRMVNADDGLGENDPFLAFAADGTPTLYEQWNDYHGGAVAGINYKPLLTRRGEIAVTDAQLDDKQRTARISRAALVLEGSTLSVIYADKATVPEFARVAAAYAPNGSALNIDAGGSTGWYYGGRYVLGPGRRVPNALVFIGG